MALSKSNRIIILLIIDSVFFLLELIVGYAVHSLALVADSFHMLNDVLSLVVGLWAVKVANQESNSKTYTYGWQRAETLGALVNGVFLVALCMSIFLEAIQRLVEPQEVKNPKLVMIVGCFGLLSNILGLLLFHEHSHGHGHGVESDLEVGHEEEESYEQSTQKMADERNTVASIMPENIVGIRRQDEPDVGERPQIVGTGHVDDGVPGSPSTPRRNREQDIIHRRSRGYSGSKSRVFGSLDNIRVYPADRYQNIITAGQQQLDDTESTTESEDAGQDEALVDERTTLLGKKDRAALSYTNGHGTSKAAEHDEHRLHNHAKPKTGGKAHGGHAHGDLNMRGVFLHVIGDALGNIGVIASALIIWLTDYSWRFYVDPGISLIITIIILCSAIPLCKAASRILLQAVPAGMSIDHIQEDINSIRGVISSHHLHVWQLSDTKLVASIHVQVGSEIKDEGSDSYMKLAKEIRQCLHAYGIHSSTVQPEFVTSDLEFFGPQSSPSNSNPNGASDFAHVSSSASSVREGSACLLECGDECPGKQCCPKK
ncbi:cation efflux protein [Talaromyces proteolyticus]|uniref:Cation efflux protein n=1 Tax=Talaromyces proteolyticus TaxID=1131652 RepID=A0AAD4KLQ8_9EURO|nr:cation efflux protein [Talaromyces proteolyticus]KAH8692106.1 cation efflux protein [Talaromyces proteolyticus]